MIPVDNSDAQDVNQDAQDGVNQLMNIDVAGGGRGRGGRSGIGRGGGRGRGNRRIGVYNFIIYLNVHTIYT